MMIDTDTLSRRMEIDSSILPHSNVTQNEMSLKMEEHSKWNETQNRMSLKMDCHSKWNVTQNGMPLKWNATQNGM